MQKKKTQQCSQECVERVVGEQKLFSLAQI